MKTQRNTAGALGFIFAMFALLAAWVPYVGGIFWVLGAILSCVGLSNPAPRGLAWAGLVISGLWIVAFLAIGCTIGTLAAFCIWPYWIW